MNFDLIVKVISEVGSVGILLWLVHRTYSDTLPKITERFEKALNKLQESFENHVNRERDDFKSMLEQQRSDFERIISREQEIHITQTDKIAEAVKKSGTETIIT